MFGKKDGFGQNQENEGFSTRAQQCRWMDIPNRRLCGRTPHVRFAKTRFQKLGIREISIGPEKRLMKNFAKEKAYRESEGPRAFSMVNPNRNIFLSSSSGPF